MIAAAPTQGQANPSNSEPAYQPEINAFAANLIRCKAKRLICRPGFTSSDQDDIEQDLSMMLLRHLQKFDPRRTNYRSFVISVIQQSVARILRHRHAERRSHLQGGTSLNVAIDDGEGNRVEMAAVLVDGQQKRHTGQHPRDDAEMSDLVHDIADTIADLPPTLQEICERLKCDTVSKVAQSMGIPRGKLLAILGRIRQRFEKAGMQNFL